MWNWNTTGNMKQETGVGELASAPSSSYCSVVLHKLSSSLSRHWIRIRRLTGTFYLNSPCADRWLANRISSCTLPIIFGELCHARGALFSYLLMLYALDIITGGGTIMLETGVVHADGSVSIAGLLLALYVGSGLGVLRTCGISMYFE